MTKLKAKLVTISITTRVVVDENNTTEQELIDTAKENIIKNRLNDIEDNVESIEDDTETPLDDNDKFEWVKDKFEKLLRLNNGCINTKELGFEFRKTIVASISLEISDNIVIHYDNAFNYDYLDDYKEETDLLIDFYSKLIEWM